MNIILLIPFLFWTDNVHAYLDPGTGSLMIQSMIAGAAGGLFVIKTYWYKIKSFFTGQKYEIGDLDTLNELDEAGESHSEHDSNNNKNK